MFVNLLISLVLTVIFESILAILAKIKDKYNLYQMFLINCLTNPIVVYLANLSLLINNFVITNILVIILEIVVIIVEGYLIKKNLKDIQINSYKLSVYLNVISFFIGLIISYIVN